MSSAAKYVLASLLLAGCAGNTTCAPNGTCWPADHQPVREARIVTVPDTAAADALCHPAVTQQWQVKPSATIYACALLLRSSGPVIVLPERLPDRLVKAGWSVDLLRQYEQANVDGVTDYSRNKVTIKN